MINSVKHIPVMLKQSIKAMNITPNGSYIDATFGFGGHSQAILNKLSTRGRLYAIDKDPSTIKVDIQLIVIRFNLKIRFCFLLHGF